MNTTTNLNTTNLNTTAMNSANMSTHIIALTPMEERVALLTAQGMKNREIGTELFMSHRTVETHLSRVFCKLGVTSRVQVAVWFARHQGFGSQPNSITSAA
jgi:DNA-binding NarL/FixJ family response regulator